MATVYRRGDVSKYEVAIVLILANIFDNINFNMCFSMKYPKKIFWNSRMVEKIDNLNICVPEILKKEAYFVPVGKADTIESSKLFPFSY